VAEYLPTKPKAMSSSHSTSGGEWGRVGGDNLGKEQATVLQIANQRKLPLVYCVLIIYENNSKIQGNQNMIL
jgi:hypothetical protein